MNSEAEMRQVLLHAADKCAAAKDRTIHCSTNHMTHNGPTYTLPKDALLALGYAEGVLRLLASYLKVDPDKRSHAIPEPGWTDQQPNGKPRATGPGDIAVEKVERNLAIAAARQAGESRKDVAQRFQISERRVDQIVEAHRRKVAS